MQRSGILIVGGGIGGVATAWSLARRGAEGVVLLERERQLGAHATAQNAAILRTPTPDALVESLSREGADFLRAPPAGFWSARTSISGVKSTPTTRAPAAANCSATSPVPQHASTTVFSCTSPACARSALRQRWSMPSDRVRFRRS